MGEVDRLLPSESVHDEDFDLCFVFRKHDRIQHLVAPAEAKKRIARICCARKPYCVGDDLETLPEFYHLKDLNLAALTLELLDAWLYDLFVRLARDQCGAIVRETLSRNGLFRMVFLTLPDRVAKDVADEIKYPLQLEPTLAPRVFFKDNPNFTTPFKHFDKAIEADDGMHCMVTHGTVWRRYLRTTVDGREERSIFTEIDRARLLMRSLEKLVSVEHMLEHSVMECYYLPPRPVELQILKSRWASWRQLHKLNQPLFHIRNYFGEDVALYFAWTAEFARALIAPAAVGVIFSIAKWRLDPTETFRSKLMDIFRVLYSIGSAVWYMWFIYRWKARQDLLTLQWGLHLSNSSLTEQPERADFRKDSWIVDPSNPHRVITWYSPLKQQLRLILANLCTILATVCAVLIVNDEIHVAVCHWFGIEDNVEEFAESFVPAWSNRFFSPRPLIVALLAFACEAIFNVTSYKLTRFENHKYHKTFDRSLITKLFVFAAFDYFIPLYYLAFVKMYSHPCYDEDPVQGRCLKSLASQIKMLFLVAMLSNLVELFKPRIWSRVQQWWYNRKCAPSAQAYEKEFYKCEYEGTRGDFQEMMFIMMLVGFFGVAWPILSLLAFIVVVVEIRIDAIKLTSSRRPFPRPAHDIGTWNGVLTTVSNITIVTNIALCAFTTFGKSLPVFDKLVITIICSLAAHMAREFTRWGATRMREQVTLLRQQQAIVECEATWGKHVGKIDLMQPSPLLQLGSLTK